MSRPQDVHREQSSCGPTPQRPYARALPNDSRSPRARHRTLSGSTEEVPVLELALDPYELGEEMRAAGCTDLERQSLFLWLRVRRAQAVAEEIGVSRAKVVGMIRNVQHKLALWRAQHPRGLSHSQILAVYAAEVNRFGRGEEHHCPPGEEECARDGICKRRWYLFREEVL